MFSALSDNIETNLSLPQLFDLYKTYNSNIEIETYQLTGTGEMIDGIYYDIIDENSLAALKEQLH